VKKTIKTDTKADDTFKVIRNEVKSKFHPNVPLSDDVWDAAFLGLHINKHIKESKLIFTYIKQLWLKEAVKKFIKYSATNKQFHTLKQFITSFNTFSEFIVNNHPDLIWDNLNRDVILDYLNYLNVKQLGYSAKKEKISALKQLLELGKINSWFTVPSYLTEGVWG
jgi:integrase/recombinase XerD